MAAQQLPRQEPAQEHGRQGGSTCALRMRHDIWGLQPCLRQDCVGLSHQQIGSTFCVHSQVGADKSFEPSVYSHNREVNRQQQADSLQRSYVGSGDILAFHPAGGVMRK